MDDPDWAWPAWKFGLRRDDLFTSLHERYNTFTYSLQDPEAFHHDVYEISTDADTPEQFHRLMADRRQQRVRELNESLDTLAVEIIANPKLMGSDQWQHALQLFRTKSFDSIVRYFASYLPDHYLDRHDSQSSTCSSCSDADTIHTLSTKASSADNALFLDEDFFPNGPVVTVEPCTLDDHVHRHEPCSGDAPSPSVSEAMSSESSVTSLSDVDSRSFSSTNPPSRSMSFSGSESGHIVPGLTRGSLRRRDADEPCHPQNCGTADTSVYSLKEARPSFDYDAVETVECTTSQSCGLAYCEEDDEFPTTQFPEDQLDYLDYLDSHNMTTDAFESDTPTPRQEGITAVGATCCYMDHRPVPVRRVASQRSLSPKSAFPCRQPVFSMRDVRRSPEEASSRIQKLTQDAPRKRPKGRRRLE